MSRVSRMGPTSVPPSSWFPCPLRHASFFRFLRPSALGCRLLPLPSALTPALFTPLPTFLCLCPGPPGPQAPQAPALCFALAPFLPSAFRRPFRSAPAPSSSCPPPFRPPIPSVPPPHILPPRLPLPPPRFLPAASSAPCPSAPRLPLRPFRTSPRLFRPPSHPSPPVLRSAPPIPPVPPVPPPIPSLPRSFRTLPPRSSPHPSCPFRILPPRLLLPPSPPSAAERRGLLPFPRLFVRAFW